MIVEKNNSLLVSTSPHSISLEHNLTTPAPGFDNNPLIMASKKGLTQGLQGLSMDGTGLLGTGVFAGDISTWGISELVLGVIGLYSLYAMFYQTKQTKYRLEASAGRRRKSKASKLRAKAKKLEEQTEGIF